MISWLVFNADFENIVYFTITILGINKRQGKYVATINSK